VTAKIARFLALNFGTVPKILPYIQILITERFKDKVKIILEQRGMENGFSHRPPPLPPSKREWIKMN